MARVSRGWIVLAYGLLASGVVAGPVAARDVAAAPTEDPHRRIHDQIARADAARRDGRLADAARLYADAYRTTSALDDYRASDVALDLALLAAAVHREAFEASDRDHAHLERARELLRTVIDDWEAAGRPVPPAVLEELGWVDEQLAEAPAPATAAPAAPEPELAPAGVEAPAQGDALHPVLPVPPPPATTTTPTRPSKALGIALVSGGAATTVAGAVLIGMGSPLEGEARRYRDDVLHSDRYVHGTAHEQAIIEEQLQAYVVAEERRGIALVATGGALLGVGVATVVVGAVRLRRVARTQGPKALLGRISPRARIGRGSAVLGLQLRL